MTEIASYAVVFGSLAVAFGILIYTIFIEPHILKRQWRKRR